jgi:hypothetical protein
VLRRFAEYHDLEGAFGRRAVTERAKGILMERHSVDDTAAFETLRDHSRAGNHKLVDIAAAVLDGHALLPKQSQAPPYGGEGSRSRTLGAQPETRQSLIQAAEGREALAQAGEHEHSPNGRVGADQRELASTGQRVTQAANKHPQHRGIQKADAPEVDDEMRPSGVQRIIDGVLELRRV